MIETQKDQFINTSEESDKNSDTMSEDTQALLENLVSKAGVVLNLDVFMIDEVSGYKNAMLNVCLEIYRKNNFIQTLNTTQDCMVHFLSTVQSYYKKNYYHNALHAADVTNTMIYLINECGARQMEGVTDLDIIACTIGATVHDVGHPGFNNQLMIDMNTSLALIYNDQSVLENYHCFLTYQILSKNATNITKNLTKEQYNRFRKTLVTIVLNTDLSKQASILKEFNNKMDTTGLDIKTSELDRLLFYTMLMKTSDVGHGAKSIDLHKSWSRRITEEFYNQGDREQAAGLSVSPLCDRSNNVPKSQIGFLNFLVLPLNTSLNRFLKSDNFVKNQLNQIEVNKKYWEGEKAKEENGEQSKFMEETSENLSAMKITKIDIQNLMFPLN